MAADAAGLLAALKISRAHIFGVSMGGMIAQELALGYPAMVHKLILGCTACGRGALSTSSLGAFAGSAGRDPAAWSLLFSPDFIDKHRTSLAAFWNKVTKHHSNEVESAFQLNAVMQHDTCKRLDKIDAETLILTGNLDPVIVPSNSDELKKIPKSELIKGGPFAGAFHGFPYSHWKETAMAIANFLK
jgi:pimeloyl-ACP methyl ester carboxylesterase